MTILFDLETNYRERLVTVMKDFIERCAEADIDLGDAAISVVVGLTHTLVGFSAFMKIEPALLLQLVAEAIKIEARKASQCTP